MSNPEGEMTHRKLTWRSLLPCCSKAERHSEPKKHNSIQMTSPSDLSNLGAPLDVSDSLIGLNLHVFTLAELKMITRNFSQIYFLGEGGFGSVHRGFIDEQLRPGLAAQTVAIKRLNLNGVQGHREWLTEVKYLGRLRHSNLIKLIGYCCEDEHRLLVYEYMEQGSLENHLFGRYSGSLPWATRMKIALEAAKGVAFLHGAEQPVIYRDFKTSNILLDADYNAKLSDFGLVKDGPIGDKTHVTTRVMGTHSYAAPEYVRTGKLRTMNDVYSFGVVLLELLTGRYSWDVNRPPREQNLIEWAKPYVRNSQKLYQIIDSKLQGQYPLNGAQMTAELAYHCLSHDPKNRPTMDTVVETLERLQGFNNILFGP